MKRIVTHYGELLILMVRMYTIYVSLSICILFTQVHVLTYACVTTIIATMPKLPTMGVFSEPSAFERCLPNLSFKAVSIALCPTNALTD